ncbi:hypothetical protein [Williamsia sp. D3]|uniref:hypothetical protein n=1 Tax=Williamsia sp. D3 TaxID=1313067 RepID=UPI0012696A01|nr:hypothetical protein [Williamsia sp. D3]
MGDRIYKSGEVLTVHEIDWSYDSDGQPTARFLAEPSGGKQLGWRYRLRGHVGSLDPHVDEVAENYESVEVYAVDAIDLDDPNVTSGVVANTNIRAGDLTGHHLGRLVGTHTDAHNVLAKILQIHTKPKHPTHPGTVVRMRIGDAPGQPGREDGGLLHPDMILELIELET